MPNDQPDRANPEAQRLRDWLQNIHDVWVARTELFMSETDCAASMADRALAALDGHTLREMKGQGVKAK